MAHTAEERGGLGGASAGSRGDRRRKPGPPLTPTLSEGRPDRGPGSPGRCCRPVFPHPSQPLQTWRRPWPPRAGPCWRRAAGQQAGGRRHRSPREEGAGPSSGLSGTAPGLGPAGDSRGAAESSCVRQRSEARSRRGSSSGAGRNGAQPPERGLKLLFPHRRGEAQCLVLYEQPSCIYSLPP